jgi:hypothetical protein
MAIIDYLAGLYHAINDIFVFLGWLFSNLVGFLHNLFLPVNYVFQYLKGFSQNAFSPAISPSGVWIFPENILALFNTIPYWSTIQHVFLVALGVMFAVFILRNLTAL